ncbi:hypothetical protein COV16_06580 [Candidatus Woesearchaeota archaeon CG10_big_fil_rev_8_21_14_0_10_34_8]|nr:MAG: hypothetical protein COV16_06580 [Candidatus Woesearchaeota archaeon CG10_big_fil_rev_8_21_14_0_10_34_8]
MINKKDLAKIRKQLGEYENKREDIIKLSRDIVRLSKMAISSVHRKDLAMAGKNLAEVEKIQKKLKKSIAYDPKLSIIGAYSVAMQEYVEAKTFLHFVKTKKLLPFSSLEVDPEDYLMGLADLTGELSRKAVLNTISKHYHSVHLVRDFVEGIHDFFLTLSLRNGELRRKYDAIKWNLKRIEDVAYDIEMKKN